MAGKLPIIGLTTSYTDSRDRYSLPMLYADSIKRAGGLPLMFCYGSDPLSLELIEPALDQMDGLLLIGGDDADPAAWGEARHPQAVGMDPRRETFERALFAAAEKRKLPMLGICFGMQLINISRGGSLHQFLPDLPRENPIEHRVLELGWGPRHDVSFEIECNYTRRLGTRTVKVNSAHKQAIHRMGDGLRVLARSPDGIIEAVDDPSYPTLLLGVQWHPERLPDMPEHRALFEMLIEQSRRVVDPK